MSYARTKFGCGSKGALMEVSVRSERDSDWSDELKVKLIGLL